MNFTLSVWRRRDGLWERIQDTMELDIVDTDALAEFELVCPSGRTHPYFFPPNFSAPIPSVSMESDEKKFKEGKKSEKRR